MLILIQTTHVFEKLEVKSRSSPVSGKVYLKSQKLHLDDSFSVLLLKLEYF